MEPVAHLDAETASPTDLVAVGVDRYCEDVQTRAWGFKYRLNGAAMKEWRPGWDDPVDLLQHIERGGKVVCHSAAFERNIWNRVILVKHGKVLDGWPAISIEQQSCTLARSAAMNLPQALEKVANVLGGPQKDMEGSAVMKKMAKPRKANPDGTYLWWDGSITDTHGNVIGYDDPKGTGQLLLQRNMDYCGQDVVAEEGVDTKVPELSEEERRVWVFDQIINERGVKFDVPVVERAVELVEYAKKQADREMRRITKGKVKRVSTVKDLVAWLQSRGVECEAVNKGTFHEVEFNAETINDLDALEAVKLRKATSKTSTAKYKKILMCVNALDRLCFMLAYHGASTGRWAGRLAQPQNFPRFDIEKPEEAESVAYLIELLSDDTVDIPEVYGRISVIYGSPLEVLALALRSMIIAEVGHRLMGGDFSNIEGRVNAWLAGETWRLEAFDAYDKGEGEDLYKVSYAAAFKVSIESIVKKQRQVGKVQELASGYQGGVGAYIDMAENYGMSVYELAMTVKQNTWIEDWKEIEHQYESAKDKNGLPRDLWTALKILVNAWRAASPMIVKSWWAYQDAAIEAISRPGTVVDPADMSHDNNITPGRLSFLCDGQYLYIRLPSGRVLSYSQPSVRTTEVKMKRKDGTEYTQIRRSVWYWGVNSYTNKWDNISLYGGKICENIVQAVARDFMVHAMFLVEDAGYPIILTVHDEILAEVPEGVGTLEEFKRLMSIKPSWGQDMPLAVSAWEAQRYIK